MRIGIDISVVGDIKTGVEYYVFNLLKALFEIDKQNQYFLFLNKYIKITPPPNFTKVLITSSVNYSFWRQTVLPINLKKYKIDVFHSPIMAFPLSGKAKKIVTIHDLAWVMFPRFYLMRNRVAYRTWLALIVKYVDKIISVSENTKKDILKLYPRIENKIEVTYLSADEKFKTIKDMGLFQKVKKNYGIDGRFILSVGTLHPRKNFCILLRAFARLKQSYKIAHKLVIIGKKGHAYNDLLKMKHELNLTDDVIFPNYVKEEDMPYIYGAADIFVYPSLYEGFGMPILEAMACSVPIIAANTSSLREVAGDAAILVNPYDAGDLSNAIWNLLTDRKLYSSYIVKGLERIKIFSWDKTARQTVAIYEQVYKK